MKQNMPHTVIVLVLSMVFCLTSVTAAGPSTRDREAKEVLQTTGVKGGLVLHLGCGEGRLAAALAAGQGYLVEGLDTSQANVERAREHVQSLGLYGQVSIKHWDGTRLPYIDNLMNLVVADDLGEVSMREVMRVLAPHGVACIRRDGSWTKTVKPWPDAIDEWTH